MTNVELASKIKALKELKGLVKECEAEIEMLESAIKEEMLSRNTEEMEVGTCIVRWTVVLTDRFDSTSFKSAMPDIYNRYIKQTKSRRFSISG